MNVKRWLIAFLLLCVLLVALLALNLCVGSVSLPLSQVGEILQGRKTGMGADILLRIRLPRAVAAAVLGGGLALSGYLLQTFFHNPIAGPYILGVSSGAKLTVALLLVFAVGQPWARSSWAMIGASCAGALAAMGFVLLLSRAVDRMSVLIVGGVMIGYICSAITDFVVTFAQDADIVNLHNWSRGSFSGIGWENVRVMSLIVAATLLGTFLLSKPIGAFQMGEAYAKSMGLNVRAFGAVLVVLSSILSACVTAFAGPISFVGVAAPHLVKSLFRTAKPILLVPGCFLGGASFCLLCDLLARSLFAPTELGISTVTALFGAPVVLWILVRRRKEG